MLTGKLLIAKPYLGDPNFERTVVLVCDHSDDGAFGLVLNQLTDSSLSELFDEIYMPIPVSVGGPVENNTLHYIHKFGAKIEGSIKLMENVYWSGSFEQVKALVNQGIFLKEDVRFFLGYSGWGKNQLEEEIEQDVWVVADCKPEIIFEADSSKIWNLVLRSLGGDFIALANAPIDPRLN